MESQTFSYDSAAAAAHYSNEKDYWLQRLSGDLPNSRFQVDREGGLVEPDVNTRRFSISGPLFQRLNKIVSGSDLRLHMVLTSAVSVLLHKYTGEEDILVGTSIFKQKTDGNFTNTTFVLRNRITGESSFKELLLQMRQTISEASANANYPIEVLIYQLGLSTAVNEFPLFDVAVLLENIQDPHYLKDIPNGVTFVFSRRPDVIEGRIEYNGNKYSETSIALLQDHVLLLLEQAIFDVEKKISTISITPAHEREKILSEFNATSAEYPLDKNLAWLTAETTLKHPDRVAIVDDQPGPEANRHITFRELDRRAAILADRLKDRRVKEDSIVAILLERSLESVVSMLAVLKAGGAYLPLDHEAPDSRNLFILQDSGTVAILSRDSIVRGIGELMDRFPTEGIIDIGTLDWEVNRSDTESTGSPASSLAYVIYTSGTTGNPKGVMVEQRNVVNFIYGLRDQVYSLYGDSLRLGLVSPFIFDASGQQTYGALLLGHTLVIVPNDIRVDGRRLLSYYNRHRVDVADGTPMYIRMLLEASGGSAGLVKVKHFIMGGDVLSRRVVLDFLDLYPSNPPNIMNVYGPTECSINCTSFMVDRQVISPLDRIPIGKPIPNYRIYILDKQNRLSAVGAPGELCVSGDGVVRGYLNRDELTTEKFVDDPFYKGARMYRTGDLARWLPDGNIEFLGRMDNQIKLRGYRIELGEIENRLLGHPDISEAAAVIREANGDPYLCAYVVCVKELTLTEIHDFLSGELPDYMIPARFVPLDVMPLTPSGKVDRKALPAPEGLELGSGVTYAPPRNELEKHMARVWSDVLGKQEVGIHDNFFMIGGDSIKTIQVAARMNELGYQFDMKEIFQNPTIAALSPYIKRSGATVAQEQVSGFLPLAPSQRWFFHHFGYQRHFNQSVMLTAAEGFDEDEIRAIFGKLLEHHDALRMTFTQTAGGIVQENLGGDLPLHLEIHDLRGRSDGGEALETLAQELQSSIPLDRGPMLRLGLFRLDDGQRLLMVIHHLVVDSVSWRVIFEDLATLHHQYAEELPLTLPPRSASFKYWTERLEEASVTSEFLKELDYWRDVEMETVDAIPRDFDREPGVVEDGQTISFQCSPQDTECLQTTAHRAFYTDMNDLLLAGLALAFKEVFRTSRLLLALEGHGREALGDSVDVSRTVGWFTSLFTVILPEVRGDDLAASLMEVKEALNRIPRNGSGYGTLKYITPQAHKGDLQHRQTPRVIFNYLGGIDSDIGQMPFDVASEVPGRPQSPSIARLYDFDISGVVHEGALHMSLTYNKEQYKDETVAALWSAYKENLERLIRFCASRDAQVHTPSDFTYTGLSADALQKIQATYTLDDIYPLTPMQEGMLFHAMLEEEGSAYFEQTTYRLHGALDIECVERTLRELSRRHEILRAAYLVEGSERPVQLIVHDRAIEFKYLDLREPDSAGNVEVEARIAAFREEDRIRSFDLGRDVLLRLAVLQISPREYEVIWSFHHILMDGWSVGILNSDFFELYSNLVAGSGHMPGPPVPFRVYVKWMMGLDSHEASSYWRRYLDGYDTAAIVPRKTDKTDSGDGYDLEKLEIQLDGAGTKRLEELGARLNVTMNTMIQAIWGIVLAKHNSKRDVVFGSVVSGRPPSIPGIDSIVGLFINSVPIRVRYSLDTTFSQLLKTMQVEAGESERFHHFPLVEIQAKSKLRNELLDSLISFQNYPIAQRILDLLDGNKGAGDGPLFTVSRAETFEHNSFDFNIVVGHEENLVIELKYNARLYDKGLVEKVCRHIQEVIDTVVEDCDVFVDDIQVSHDYIVASAPTTISAPDEDFRL
jgi:amino acid adenylation domain-containing protein/non-ribosomal peptide synthase protein (TIGR01720 family)